MCSNFPIDYDYEFENLKAQGSNFFRCTLAAIWFIVLSVGFRFLLLVHLTFGDFCLCACNLCEFCPVKFVFGSRTMPAGVWGEQNRRVTGSEKYQQVYMKRQQSLVGETLSHKSCCLT